MRNGIYGVIVLTSDGEFVQFVEVHPVVLEVTVLGFVSILEWWSKENANHSLGVFVALDVETIGEGFVVKTVLSRLDVEGISILPVVNGYGIVDQSVVFLEVSENLVDVYVLDLDTGVFQVSKCVRRKVALVSANIQIALLKKS